MGFFDFLLGGSPEKQIKKYAKKIKHKDTPVEERQAAAYWLADQGSPEAIYGLLGRFEMDYEHGMKDASEKEEVANLVLGLGDRSIEPLEAVLRRTQKFARPLALYEQLAGREKAILMILQLLDEEFERGELKVEKKRELLKKAAEYNDPRVRDSAQRFLDDYNEECRFAAVEVLIAQDETPGLRDAMLDRLVHEDEDSNRLRVRVAEIAAARRWPLEDRSEAFSANPPHGYGARDGRVVAA
ncbi:MAG: hypothetical protein H6741_26505 [Alphaproteobacteria bacterium]|nr:hypothetical protein [Alphaproteobacteria bacterium]MCB9796261.1 hypothetical protein [Alphaproteobacteria bacterium]